MCLLSGLSPTLKNGPSQLCGPAGMGAGLSHAEQEFLLSSRPFGSCSGHILSWCQAVVLGVWYAQESRIVGMEIMLTLLRSRTC